MPFKIDQVARNIALHRYVLPECLHVPIAAFDEAAITTYIGDLVKILAKGTPNKAILVRTKAPPPIDARLPIWEMEGATIFHCQMQVWVHVGYTRYRKAYQRAFPTEDIAGKVISHAMNRRIAVLKGFQYVRITPVSRNSNSSSGFSENWGVALHGAPGGAPEKARRGAFIEYADLSALMLMMDMKLGGGVMDLVNAAQALVEPRPADSALTRA
ncbi:MAG: hypothetical protein ACREP8_04975 [Candidatus Binatia bacterium]